ncbi:TnsA endonuclease N-terminal domain-containing protein [Pseudomonas koreensis]|uniref:TnsA endonuclease N-terminal domain-containing protein n=1 Tax=Pseudomonas koreensis TaxID=198620 RepID=UPI0018E69592|nr:TnsA endonuclease N-terminal domain-containing protein [Pseudomonas koreensis]MBI6945390.1 TnsA endonuclease N-terminal domain-containing protein [Pseudomonas koreensis]
MAVRKVVTRRSWHFRGYFPSLKNGQSVAFESILESGFFRLLELSPQVRRYKAQPVRESFVIGNQLAQYVPDVEVELVDGSRVWVEIKPAQHCKNHATAARLSAAKAHFAADGRRFEVVTDEVIWAEPRCKSVLEILYHRRGTFVGTPPLPDLLSRIKADKPQTIADLCLVAGEAQAWRLLGLGLIGVDLEKSLSSQSSIYLEGGHRHADFFA